MTRPSRASPRTTASSWPPPPPGSTVIVGEPDTALLEEALFEVKRVVVGQDRTLERMFVGLLARGHCLLEGVPGVAKTLAVRTLATVTGGTFSRAAVHPRPGARRHRRHPDLAARRPRPSTPSSARSSPPPCSPTRSTGRRRRCSPRCWRPWPSGRCRWAARSHRLPAPFLVLATQNPIESDGVYELPEAQRDRFLLKIDLGYPSGTEELTILARMGVDPPSPRPVLTPERVLALQRRGRPGLRAPRLRRVRGAAGAGHPRAGRVRPARAGRHAAVRRQPAGHARAGRGGPGAGPAARAELRAARRRRRRRPATCSRTGWCSASTRWPTGSTRGSWWAGSSPRCGRRGSRPPSEAGRRQDAA